MACSILRTITTRQPHVLDFAKQVALQMLRGLAFLRSAEVMHCDLKPENVMLVDRDRIRIIDFGSSCFFRERVEYFEANQYIQSRFYRAPEVILVGDVSFPIDMWSLGCIIAEIVLGTPLFPGQSCEDQVGLFVEVLGLPPEGFLRTCAKAGTFFTRHCELRAAGRTAGSNPLPRLLGYYDPGLIDFLSLVLRWDPRERLDPGTALRHGWLQGTRREDLPTSSSQSKCREGSRRKKRR
jgi:dual specificity tyrosine-phosphorylation-regulated kinase 2/3/4